MARSTFFYHQKRLTSPDKHAVLKTAIRHSFESNKHRYGYRRVWRDLRNKGWVVNHKLVYKLMDQMGLKAKIRRRRPYISYADTISRIAPNILDRNFTRDKPNTAWVSDITEFNITGRKVYLCPIMDLFDRTIISHTVSTSAATTLALASLKKSITAQAPEPGWIIHTDQGFQFQHASWRTLVEKHEGKVSMSRKGNCYDNAVIENFFSHLKTEMYHGETFNNIKEFTNAINEYINWYNNQRLQERLKGQTPMQYRNQTLQALTA